MSDVREQSAKAAFEVKKGAPQVMTLSEAEVDHGIQSYGRRHGGMVAANLVYQIAKREGGGGLMVW